MKPKVKIFKLYRKREGNRNWEEISTFFSRQEAKQYLTEKYNIKVRSFPVSYDVWTFDIK